MRVVLKKKSKKFLLIWRPLKLLISFRWPFNNMGETIPLKGPLKDNKITWVLRVNFRKKTIFTKVCSWVHENLKSRKTLTSTERTSMFNSLVGIQTMRIGEGSNSPIKIPYTNPVTLEKISAPKNALMEGNFARIGTVKTLSTITMELKCLFAVLNANLSTMRNLINKYDDS